VRKFALNEGISKREQGSNEEIVTSLLDTNGLEAVTFVKFHGFRGSDVPQMDSKFCGQL